LHSVSISENDKLCSDHYENLKSHFCFDVNKLGSVSVKMFGTSLCYYVCKCSPFISIGLLCSVQRI
jgi:hypothetical protein